ncbi:MAG: hypothetical protein Q6K55_08470 [Thermostichus sp. DG02_3_bins_51]
MRWLEASLTILELHLNLAQILALALEAGTGVGSYDRFPEQMQAGGCQDRKSADLGALVGERD